MIYQSELVQPKLNFGESDGDSTPPDLAKLGTFLVLLTGVTFPYLEVGGLNPHRIFWINITGGFN
ncbi:MAG: hypothetical protein APF76_05175 [Desulfitibacter sp. BRH_c19]|nr:MAG: hypothetical protein APF76_05175 [Desulfitibacter sp. BRH_c19]